MVSQAVVNRSYGGQAFQQPEGRIQAPHSLADHKIPAYQDPLRPLPADGVEQPPIPRNEEQAVSVSPEQMDQIKAHIVQTGESEAAFIERAAESTIKRDMVSFNMGINPATGKEGKPNE